MILVLPVLILAEVVETMVVEVLQVLGIKK
jgi:hypothetical protein